MKIRRLSFVTIICLALISIADCSGKNDDDDDGHDLSYDDDTWYDDDSWSEGDSWVGLDFEQYALGNLPFPWTTAGHGQTTIQVQYSPTGSKALEIIGGYGFDDRGIAKTPASLPYNGELWGTIDIWLEPGAVFAFAIENENGKAAYFSRDPSSGNLLAWDYSTDPPEAKDCGPLPNQTWINVELYLSGVDYGANTDFGYCHADAEGEISKKIIGLWFADLTGTEYGGTVYFDDISIQNVVG